MEQMYKNFVNFLNDILLQKIFYCDILIKARGFRTWNHIFFSCLLKALT